MQQWAVSIVYHGTVWYIPWDVAAWGGGARHEGRHLLVSLWSHGGAQTTPCQMSSLSPPPPDGEQGTKREGDWAPCFSCVVVATTPPPHPKRSRDKRCKAARASCKTPIPAGILQAQIDVWTRKKRRGHFSAECFGLALRIITHCSALFGNGRSRVIIAVGGLYSGRGRKWADSGGLLCCWLRLGRHRAFGCLWVSCQCINPRHTHWSSGLTLPQWQQ